MNTSTPHLATTSALVLMLTALIALIASTAHAESIHQKHKRAFGDRAWIADELYEGYRVKADAAGLDYERIPVAYREWEVRTELAMVGCLLARHIESRERGKLRQREIIERCWGTKRQWLIALNGALVASGRFPYAHAGQTVLATIPLKTLQRVLRNTIRYASEDNYANLFTKLIVPLLEEACAIESCTGIEG
jgi:hypothetical protein